MDNSAVLSKGREKAKEIIREHIFRLLLDGALDLLQKAVDGRAILGHNMTGNTVNSYAIGIYDHGKLRRLLTPYGIIPVPLRKKLTTGHIKKLKGATTFFAGQRRWDGEVQAHNFTATVQTNASIEPERSMKFLQSYKGMAGGWELVVCNGVEYASAQEEFMEIDVLTGSFDFAKMFIPAMFKPLPD